MDDQSMGLNSALAVIDSARGQKVLFAGETIKDIYHYVTPLGRASKEPILSVEFSRTEVYRGGIHAAAAHARTFCGSVDIWTDRSITKERWVEEAHLRKLFACYTDRRLIEAENPAFIRFDVTAVVDYGHGMFDKPEFGGAKYLAVNVQANSDNYGFNLATKYQDLDCLIDYLVVDEVEARLATGNRSDSIESSLVDLSAIAPKVVITRGRNGAIGWGPEGVFRSPAFTTRIVDTMGAGDAFFAITAPMAQHAGIEDLLLIGNAAGALKSQIVGHRSAVTKDSLIAYLQSKGACLLTESDIA